MKISKNSQIIIYGAGEVGSKAAFSLVNNGFKVIGFLDKKYGGNDMVPGFYVTNLYSSVDWNPKDVVVVIALANGNIHKSVSDMLYTMGYQYIVFLPLECYISTMEKGKLTDVYNRVLDGKCDGLEISPYRDICDRQTNCEEWIIREDTDYVWGYLDLEILYSEDYETWRGDKSKLTGIQETYDTNIILRKWYIALFEYLEGNSIDANAYFQFFSYQFDDEMKESVLRDRRRLYEIYTFEFNRGIQFFIDTAPLVQWNKKGYFNLVGGHHRIVFLLTQGLKKFPVKMKKDDYNIWINSSNFLEMTEYIQQDDFIFQMATPHPAFANYWHVRENGKKTLLEVVLRYLDSIDYKKLSVLDISGAEGYFARIMKRNGAGEVECYDKEKSDYIKKLFKLLQIKNVEISKDIAELKKDVYDTIFMLNVVRDWDEYISDNFVFLAKWKKYLFIECPNEEHRFIEKICEKDKTISMNILMREIYKEKAYNVYVLERK